MADAINLLHPRLAESVAVARAQFEFHRRHRYSKPRIWRLYQSFPPAMPAPKYPSTDDTIAMLAMKWMEMGR
jgi:hypothetical protein